MTAAFSVAALLVALFFGLRWYEQQAMYHPTHELVRTPADAALPFEDVAIATSDGETLHGWWVPSDRGDAPVVLFFHGNGGNVSHRLEKLAVLHELGATTLIIDYRGYGRSSGAPSEAGMYRDAHAAYKWLLTTRGVPADRIVAHGESLGAAVAVHLAAEAKTAGVVVESGFTSVPDIARQRFPVLPVRWVLKHDFDTLGKVHRIVSPLLILHSREDELFDMSHPERLLAAAQSRKHLVELRGGHNDAFLVSRDQYRGALATFLAGVAPTTAAAGNKEPS
ncbi:MAG: alpha/beta hydrolase [Betaproteobacteria bacterium]|nr:alpha/beta hydrolase [Betaproteobacteria bacterium]